MFAGTHRRIVCIWFPRLPSDRVLRQRPREGPFVVTRAQGSANRVYCLNIAAEQAGLGRGMSFADASAFCPDLQSEEADLIGDQQFLHVLRRWATRYCPWVGIDEDHGLVLDITGSDHLFGGEAPLLNDLRQSLMRAGLTAQIGLADSRGAAWALAHHGEGMAAPGEAAAALAGLPVAALRIPAQTDVALQRLGLRTIGDLAATARAPLARRFGADLMMRLDQALGAQPEPVAPLHDPPHFGVRMTLPEPIGLIGDLRTGTERLLEQLCEKLKLHEMGARRLSLTLRRVDQEGQTVELRLARPLRDAARILPLFERGLSEVDAGFGIDQFRLAATQVEAVPIRQITPYGQREDDRLNDLVTRIGARIGLENVTRFLPADSHIPERAFSVAAAAYSEPARNWFSPRPRPLWLFPPEPIAAHGPHPPKRFRWRRMALTTARAMGPERIAPEWWFEDENWRSGVRDYWQIETREGRRLWVFYTPQHPGWCVQGEFA